jgi:hypothetical protein
MGMTGNAKASPWAVLVLFLHSAPSWACIDESQLLGVIEAQLHSVMACYEQKRELEPTLSGKLRLNITISLAGSVTESEATSPDDLPEALLDCAEKAMLNWSFPRPPGMFRVRFPVDLKRDSAQLQE